MYINFSQLPEPILTFSLYEDMISFARVSYMYVDICIQNFYVCMQLINFYWINMSCSIFQGASHILPRNISTNCEAAKETALVELERLKKLLSCLDHQRYLTLARLFYHLHRY